MPDESENMPVSESSPDIDDPKDEEIGKDEPMPPRAVNRVVNLGVRYYDYRDFMNRVVGDNSDYTIEAFVSKQNWAGEILEERSRRDKFGSSLNKTAPHIPAISEKLGENRRIHRVRIRSPTIIRCLAHLADFDRSPITGDTQVLVFCRPFYAFKHCHDGMKQMLEDMTTASLDTTTADATENPLGNAGTIKDSAQLTQDSRLDRVGESIEDLRCYVDFVEKAIFPLWSQYDILGKQTPDKISYEDIPLLWRPGDLAYVPAPPTTSKALHRSAIQTIFKFLYCIPPDSEYELKNDKWKPMRGGTSIKLQCLDYDGERFVPIWLEMSIERFDEECEITSLSCFPLRFHPQYEALLKHHTEMGERFKSGMEDGIRHVYHSGWSLVTGMFEPDDQREKDVSDDPEYVDSEVVIDFKEASRRIPEWPPTTEIHWLLAADEAFWRVESDEATPFQIWPSPTQDGEPVLVRPDLINTRDDPLFQKVAYEYFKDDRWIHGRQTTDWNVTDYAVLPKRFLAYVLRERKFARLDIQDLHIRAKSSEVTLNNVQMRDSHRRIINSAVSTHFKNKARQNNTEVPLPSVDMIQGKGKGLIVLLHGAPGVGKTATAEAVAIQYDKPLFPITCGDLGTTPESVDRSLKNIFRYAHLWDCILLLDEADVFLTQRDRTDIERNALVSVFLRVLEYYSGILFLTTNRVGALDEAFRSRVHISLYYPHLSCQDTIEILRANLGRLPTVDKVPKGRDPGPEDIIISKSKIEEFVVSEYEEHVQIHGRGPWDGRQIRNTVLIASRLALFEAQNELQGRNGPAVLDASHFKTVTKTMAEFDRYLQLARSADQAKLTHMQGDRFDDYDRQHSQNSSRYEPRFTGQQGRARDNMGQRDRHPAETTLRSARNNNTHPYQSFPSSYHGEGYQAERLSPRLRPQLPMGDYRGYDADESYINVDAGRPTRNPRASGSGNTSQPSHQLKSQAQSQSGVYGGEVDGEGPYGNEEDDGWGGAGEGQSAGDWPPSQR